MRRTLVTLGAAAVLLVSAAGVALALAAPAAQAAPAPVCGVVAPDTADMVRNLPGVASLLGDNADAITSASIDSARDRLGCGPFEPRTRDEATAAVCASLNVDTVADLLDRLDASADVRTQFDSVKGALPAAFTFVRGGLGCGSVPAAGDDDQPATTPATPTPAPSRDPDAGKPCHTDDIASGITGNDGTCVGGSADNDDQGDTDLDEPAPVDDGSQITDPPVGGVETGGGPA